MVKDLLKKLVFLGSVALSGTLVPSVVYAPTMVDRTSYLEDRLIDKQEEFRQDFMRKIGQAREESELIISDPIYNEINNIYSSINVPGYITKKLIRIIGQVESSDNPRAISNMGARGWGQLTRDSWYGVDNLNYEENVFKIDENIKNTIKLLVQIDRDARRINSYFDYGERKVKSHWDDFSDEEKVRLIAASYNGGIGNLNHNGWDVNRMPPETREYLVKLKRASREILPSLKIYQPAF